MLRGSSRHDVLPGRQTAPNDPDRDRQREQQRKERAQMLPDDKEILAGTPDLFNAPVKVKPDDSTSLQIRRSLGNFEPIRALMEAPGSSQAHLDRGYLLSHRNPSHNSDPLHAQPPYRPSSYPNSSDKSHYQRNFFHSSVPVVNHHTSSGGGSNNINSNLTSSSYRDRAPNNHQSHSIPPPTKVPHNQSQLPHNSSSSASANFNSLNNNPHHLPPSSGPILSRSPNFSSSNNITASSNSNSFQQKLSKPNHPPYSGNSTEPNSCIAVGEVKVEGASGLSDSSSTVFANEASVSVNNSVRDAKSTKNPYPHKKPALDRTDSQIEVESILKEMTDVVPPLTAILTPDKNKDSSKLPPRRLSKNQEEIVQSILDSGMAKIPTPITKMDSSDSSSSYETESDSDSEDSASSASHPEDNEKTDNLGSSSTAAPTTGSPKTTWNLSSFLSSSNVGKPGVGTKSPKDSKSFNSLDSGDGGDEISAPNHDRIDNVSSTVSNKTQSPSPMESSTANAIEPRAKGNTRTTRGTSHSVAERGEPHIPNKPSAISIPTKGHTSSAPKVSSLSASSSDEEEERPKPPTKRKSTSVKTPHSDDKKSSSIGATAAKRPRPSNQSSATRHPNKSEGDSSPENKGKGSKNGQDKNKTDTIRKLFMGSKTSTKPSPSLETESGGKSHSSSGKQSSSSSSNRVSAKGNPHNGDSSSDKKKEISKEKSSSSSKKHPKVSGISSIKSPDAIPNSRIKEETSKPGSSHSSLIVRIPLEKLRRKPPVVIGVPPAVLKIEGKEGKGSKGNASQASVIGALIDPYTKGAKGSQQNSSRVGSSSDPSVFSQDSGIIRDRDEAMCSETERLSPLNHIKKKQKKKSSRASPKKIKPKKEPPDSHTKLEGEITDGEVSSANLLGYPPCDSITMTPPIDPDLVQAPDSSINPPHLPSPFVAPPLQYFSYFEKNDIKDDLLAREQEFYLENAKKLKHSADQERTSTTQSSMYLEAGLYFILTGIIMERDSPGNNNNASYTMYRDTLTLIQYIGNRWRSSARSSVRPDLQNQEAKIITLSMRCQALLFCKLFKMKMKETREMVSNMHEFFSKTPLRDPMIMASSPQLSTPSPHSPTSSPAGASSILPHTPSPHHQQVPIPRNLFHQIQKQCGNSYNCIMAHDTWEQADAYVAKYRLEEYFIGIDRHLGPLTLHSTLVDLVRYVRYGLQLINGS